MLSISTPPRLPDLRAGNDENYLHVSPAKQALPLGWCACSADSANNLPIGDLVIQERSATQYNPRRQNAIALWRTGLSFRYPSYWSDDVALGVI